MWSAVPAPAAHHVDGGAHRRRGDRARERGAPLGEPPGIRAVLRAVDAPAAEHESRARAADRDDEHRHVRQPLGELVDEFEQPVVRPVEVFEHEHERAVLGERLEEAPPGGERLTPAVGGARGPACSDR